jgi:hypothetical protein
MPVPSSAPTVSPIITMSTVADSIPYTLPVAIIRWHLTTAATSTWALHMLQSTVLTVPGTTAVSTKGWPLIGGSTEGPTYLGGSTLAGGWEGCYIDFTINNWVNGVVLTTISGGHVSVIKAPPGLEWVRNKPPGY